MREALEQKAQEILATMQDLITPSDLNLLGDLLEGFIATAEEFEVHVQNPPMAQVNVASIDMIGSLLESALAPMRTALDSFRPKVRTTRPRKATAPKRTAKRTSAKRSAKRR